MMIAISTAITIMAAMLDNSKSIGSNSNSNSTGTGNSPQSADKH